MKRRSNLTVNWNTSLSLHTACTFSSVVSDDNDNLVDNQMGDSGFSHDVFTALSLPGEWRTDSAKKN